MKPILILQAFGLGDVIWSQGIVHHLEEKGYKVVWPVKPHYVEGCQRAYPNISFMPDSIVKPELFDIKEKKQVDGIEIAPIRWSDSYMKLPYKDVMKAKYTMYDLDWRVWRKHAQWRRDTDRSNLLFEKLDLGLEPYNLINKYFGTNSQRNADIAVNNGKRNVFMETIPGFSLFDWFKVISLSDEIHTVSTSLFFMLEVMNLSQPIHLYPRKPTEQDFKFIDYIFTKPYILHT